MDERVLVHVGVNEGFVPGLAGVLVEMVFVEKLVDSISIGFLFAVDVLSRVNMLVPKTTLGGAEISSVILDRVHPKKNREAIIKKKIGFFIDN